MWEMRGADFVVHTAGRDIRGGFPYAKKPATGDTYARTRVRSISELL